MHTHAFNRSSLCLLLTLSSGISLATDLYRWTDENGKVHYTDRVPAEYVEQGYSIISEQGLTIHTIKAASEEAAEAAGTQEKQLSEAQLTRDRTLLMNYSSEDEIVKTRQRKIEELKALIILNEENTKSLENQYRDLTAKAGDHEKQGDSIPAALLTKLNVTKEKIKVFTASNKQRQQEIETIEQQFERDLQRYRALRDSDGEIGPEPAFAQTDSSEQNAAPLNTQQLALEQHILEVETTIEKQNQALAQMEARFKSIFSQLQEQQKGGQQASPELNQEVAELKQKIQQGYLDNLQSTSQLMHLRQQLESAP